MKSEETAVPYETVTVIDGTEYVVHTIFNQESKETAYDKIKRLILSNADGNNKSSVA